MELVRERYSAAWADVFSLLCLCFPEGEIITKTPGIARIILSWARGRVHQCLVYSD